MRDEQEGSLIGRRAAGTWRLHLGTDLQEEMSDGSIDSGTFGELGDGEAKRDKSPAMDPVTDSRAETSPGSRGDEVWSGIGGRVGLVGDGEQWDG
jgi:hypothetical protein